MSNSDDILNGFTGFSKRKPGFESAGDAMRRREVERRHEQEFPTENPQTTQRRIHDSDARAAKAGWRVNQGAPSPTPIPGLENITIDNEAVSGRFVNAGKAFEQDGMKRFLRIPNVAAGEEAPVYDEAMLAAIDDLDRRWAWVEVDLSAIRHNYMEAKRVVGPDVTVMAVVKADGYGHGAIECAKTAINSGAEWLGVATVDEGIQLRRGGVGANILMLSQPPEQAIPLLLAYQIVPSVYSPEFAIKYGEAADSIGIDAPYHLKVNTGMNRIGVRWNDVLEFMRQVQFHRALRLQGAFTHFATADLHDSMDFDFQLSNFNHALNDLRGSGIDPGIVHAANSATIFRYPDAHFDMVRDGIALYGFYPCPEVFGVADLVPAMSVHARITDVRTVPLGEGVSYGLNWRSRGYTKVCTIPVGYADGYHRGLSDRTSVIMGGRMFPQVGNICMDQSMFAVEQRSRGTMAHVEPQVGDEVCILGTEGDAFVTADEMAEKLGTNVYEVCIGFGSSRLPRVFR